MKTFAKTYILTKGNRLIRDGQPVVAWVYGSRRQIDDDIELEFVKEVELEETGELINTLRD